VHGGVIDERKCHFSLYGLQTKELYYQER